MCLAARVYYVALSQPLRFPYWKYQIRKTAITTSIYDNTDNFTHTEINF
jgi:hypothetical protein